MEDSFMLKVAATIGVTCLLGVLVYVSWFNIGPYVEFIRGQDTGTNWLDLIPGLGSIIRWFNTSVSVLVGFLLWVLIQTGQVMWILIMLDRKAVGNALKNQQRNSELYDTTAKDFMVRKIAKRSSRVPLLFIRWSHFLALFSYVVDGIMGVSMFPPAKSLQALLIALTVGSGQGIYWGNVSNLLMMMFAFEPIFYVSIIVFQWLKTHREA